MPFRNRPENDAHYECPPTASYLADLRNNRPARPSGSRPLPVKMNTAPAPARPAPTPIAPDQDVDSGSGINAQSMTALPQIKDDSTSPAPSSFHRRTQSDMPNNFSISSRTSAGRPLARDVSQSSYSIRGRKFSPTATIQVGSVSPDRAYRESGTRWIERQEAISIRDALQEMDVQDEERMVHDAAQDEAAELVWRHRNLRAAEEEKAAAYMNPDLPTNRFKAHLEKGAHARSQSQSYGELAKRTPCSGSSHSVSGSSISSHDFNARTNSSGSISKIDKTGNHMSAKSQQQPQRTSLPLGEKVPSMRRKSGTQRNISNGSTKGLFRNPEDEIYEEPEQAIEARDSPHVRFEETAPLGIKQRNSMPHGTRPLPQSDSQRKRLNPFEIHKNPPSQTRNAGYTSNNVTPDQSDAENVPVKDGKEKRSDDIRAATSMKRRDRSPNLPTPTAVSDRAGRPIVSFDPSWQPTKIQPNADPSSPAAIKAIPSITIGADIEVPTVPSITVGEVNTTPTAPTIVLPEETFPVEYIVPQVPTINLHSEDAPNVPSSNPSTSSSTTRTSARPLPDPSVAQKETQKSRLPWLHRNQPSFSRAGVPTATCANCALPIAGRVVTASGSGSNSAQKARFHPECFTCFHCSTGLEAAEFYPEPENKRLERLEREGLKEGYEGAELRFYCHLDFHEFFSPRCRSCKTPIEGEVIVAAGGEWHVGHFFCAECGNVRITIVDHFYHVLTGV